MIGCISYKVPSHLVHFFVDESNNWNGVGKQLWIHLFSHLKHVYQQQKSFKVTVNSSLYAVPIYQKLGFNVVSEICEFNGIHFIKMILDVS